MSETRLPLRQFSRYATVGLVSNGVLYVVYLAFTWYGLGPKFAMSLVFIMGIIQTFMFNRSWSFSYQFRDPQAFIRYVLAYFSAYCLNLGLLLICVDRLGWPHQAVQAAVIVGLAFYLFLLQKFWVFPNRR